MITQSEAPAPEEIVMHKHISYLSVLSGKTVETGLIGGTRASVTPEKRIPKKNIYI